MPLLALYSVTSGRHALNYASWCSPAQGRALSLSLMQHCRLHRKHNFRKLQTHESWCPPLHWHCASSPRTYLQRLVQTRSQSGKDTRGQVPVISSSVVYLLSGPLCVPTMPHQQAWGFESVAEVLTMARSKLAVPSRRVRRSGASGNSSMLVA